MKELIFEVYHVNKVLYFYDDGTYKYTDRPGYRSYKLEGNKLYYRMNRSSAWEEWINSSVKRDILAKMNEYITEKILLGDE